MIIVLKPDAPEDHAQRILTRIESLGLKPLFMPGSERVVLGAIGDERSIASLNLEADPHVERVAPVLAPYKLVSRELHPHDSIVHLGDHPVGGQTFTVIAGPCAIESAEQMQRTAESVRAAGGHALRGGAFKPRTSPYSFQGLGAQGLRILQQVSQNTSLPTVTEVVEVADIPLVAEFASAFQVGARNMQNFRLLSALGQQRKPVILKRGMAAKIDDLLLAAEYILSEGNPNVILCERGITTFETSTRNTLDLNAIPLIKQRTHLPVLVDPSHGTGIRSLVAPMSMAAAACGADGILVEVHCDPTQALSDGPQSLFPEEFARLMQNLEPLVRVLGKELSA
ncbi:MAG: 3-deoxy-7-phosphoheptulonate synthase [Myxococcota bacterium]